MVKILKSDEFESEVIKSDPPVLVDFFAVWCGPCKMMSPVIDDLAEKFKEKIKFFKIDIDESKDLAEKFGIMSVPAFVVFKDGKEHFRQVGSVPRDTLENLLSEFI
jgi:thioredoxin 1